MLTKIHLPEIFTNESLFSWSSRYHQLSLNPTAKLTSYVLFGSNNAGLKIDIPFNLKNFENNTEFFLDSANHLLFNHTNFGFYEKFLNHAHSQGLANSFINGKHYQARAKLGLNKFPAEFLSILKVCPKCNADQIKFHPTGYWITEHQFPSSFTCKLHQQLLNFIEIPTYRGYATSYLLPSTSNIKSTLHNKINDPELQKHLKDISNWGYFINDQAVKVPPEILRWCYFYRSLELDYLSFDGCLRGHQVRDRFQAYYGEETINFFGKEITGDLYNANFGFISFLFRKYNSQRHPLKDLLFINFLFESFDAFQKVYFEVVADLQIDEHICQSKIKLNQKTLVHQVLNEGQSLNKIAESLNTSVTSAAKFLDKKKISRKKRPRIVNTPTEIKLKKMLVLGESRSVIALTLNLKKTFIKDYLARNKDLKQQWERAYHKRQIDIHRKQLLSTLNKHPDLPIKSIRRLPNNGFQWLYNHDKDWLTKILPALWKR